MPRPSINTGKTSGKDKPAGLPKPRAKPKKENVHLEAARDAVQEFETQHRLLLEMRKDWLTNFPEARLAQEDILLQEDSVADAVKSAKPLVAKAKESVGDFIAKRKFSKPCYDPSVVTKLISELEDGLTILDEMMGDGIVKLIDLDKDAALAWFAQRPAYSEKFQDAFKEEKEMTTAVTVPKI